MRQIAFEVPGQPVPWHGYTRYDDSAAKQRLKAYQEHIRVVAIGAMNGLPSHLGRVDLSIEFWFQIPNEKELKKKQPHVRKQWLEEPWLQTPDETNCFKGAEDALQNVKKTGLQVMFENDRQVCHGQTAKHHWDQEPKTVFIVRFL